MEGINKYFAQAIKGNMEKRNSELSKVWRWVNPRLAQFYLTPAMLKKYRADVMAGLVPEPIEEDTVPVDYVHQLNDFPEEIRANFFRWMRVMDRAINRYYDKQLAKIKARKENLENALMYATLKTQTDNVQGSGCVVEISIGVEWARSRMYNANPTATAIPLVGTGITRTYLPRTEGKASGCGYDKLSQAIADALNETDIVPALLTEHVGNGGKLPYGSYDFGMGVVVAGGVGVSCYRALFEAIGYEFSAGPSGKMFDTFTIQPAKKGE